MTLKKKKIVNKKPKIKAFEPSFSQISYSLQSITDVLSEMESNYKNYSKPSKDLLAKIFDEWAAAKEASKNKNAQRIVPFLKGISEFYAT